MAGAVGFSQPWWGGLAIISHKSGRGVGVFFHRLSERLVLITNQPQVQL